jgi:hypothetical protein
MLLIYNLEKMFHIKSESNVFFKFCFERRVDSLNIFQSHVLKILVLHTYIDCEILTMYLI